MNDKTPGTEITHLSLDDKIKWSKAIAAAGQLIPQAFRDPAKVLVAVEYGNMLGVHPLVAMNDVYVIEGTPTMSAHLMSATVRRAGHTLRVRTKGSWAKGDFEATATLIRSDDPEPFTATWDKDRATRANLTAKGNWKNYPEAMCKARAISEVCRDGASEALMGIKYTAEEISEVPVTEAGDPTEVIEDAVIVEDQDPEVADEWARKGDAAEDLATWRAVWKEAHHHGYLGYALSSGEVLGEVLKERGAHLKDIEAQAAAGEPEPTTVTPTEATTYDESELV